MGRRSCSYRSGWPACSASRLTSRTLAWTSPSMVAPLTSPARKARLWLIDRLSASPPVGTVFQTASTVFFFCFYRATRLERLLSFCTTQETSVHAAESEFTAVMNPGALRDGTILQAARATAQFLYNPRDVRPRSRIRIHRGDEPGCLER